LNTPSARALFNNALQAASGTAPLNLNNIASGAAAVVAAVSGGALTETDLTNLGLTGVTSTNLEAIRTRIDATSTGTDASLVNSMSELRAIVVNASGELANGVNLSEAAGGVDVAVALDGASVGQTITLTLPGSGGGTAQSITQNVTSTDLANGFALINISQAQLSASGQGSKTVTASINSGTPFAVDTFIYDLIEPTATVGSATYYGSYASEANFAAGAITRTIVLNGTDFNTLLEAGETATTDIKARLDWSKLSYDFDRNNTGVDGAFTLADIESARVTNGTTLTIKLTSAKAKALESYNDVAKGDYFGADVNAGNTYWTTGAGAGKGNQADGIDVLSGFFRDTAGNASTNSTADAAITYAAPVSVLRLGNDGYFGNLIAPVVVAVNTGTRAAPVWVNKTFYYWDLDGSSNTATDNSNFTADFVHHDFLDRLFYQNSTFDRSIAAPTLPTTTTPTNPGSAYDTTSEWTWTGSSWVAGTNFRYGDLTAFNNIRLALTNAGIWQNESAFPSPTATSELAQTSDLTAIFAAFGSAPAGWQNGAWYWSATSNGPQAHVSFAFHVNQTYPGSDSDGGRTIALQVL
jgi:hypothetical protein